ncbi:MAG: transposase [Anaerolineae bacterium]|nr:transposase [Anaerolineae bacterium]
MENTRACKRPKREPKRLFTPEIYKRRFSSERTFAWIDKFCALPIRIDHKTAHFMGAHYIVYTLTNLCRSLAQENLNKFDE